jgi:hypothetical protein
MMLEHGAWTWWETFVGGSRCHAWSSSPTHYLSSQVLGVQLPRPAELGTVRIRPRPGTLTWARGTYPHPAGPIRVEWEIEEGELRVSCEAPDGVNVETIIRSGQEETTDG